MKGEKKTKIQEDGRRGRTRGRRNERMNEETSGSKVKGIPNESGGSPSSVVSGDA